MVRVSRARLLLLIIGLSGLICVALQSTSGERKASASGGAESFLDHLRPARARLTLEVPPGTHLHVRLADRITDQDRAGDVFLARLDGDLAESGFVVIPGGSRVIGRITRLGEDTERSGATQVSLVLEQMMVGKKIVPVDSRALTLSKPRGIPEPESDSLFYQGSGFPPGQGSARGKEGTIYEPDTRLTFVLAGRLRLPVFVPSE